jgi:hypothetical protein
MPLHIFRWYGLTDPAGMSRVDIGEVGDDDVEPGIPWNPPM